MDKSNKQLRYGDLQVQRNAQTQLRSVEHHLAVRMSSSTCMETCGHVNCFYLLKRHVLIAPHVALYTKYIAPHLHLLDCDEVVGWSMRSHADPTMFQSQARVPIVRTISTITTRQNPMFRYQRLELPLLILNFRYIYRGNRALTNRQLMVFVLLTFDRMCCVFRDSTVVLVCYWLLNQTICSESGAWLCLSAT